MAPSKIAEAPQQYKQPSRKGKKAWRKHVDVSQVQAGLEDAREEVIKGGIVAEKASDDLFTLDTEGDKTIQASVRKIYKPLKADEILAQRSAIPSLTARKRPRGTTDGIIDQSVKRRKSEGVTRKEYERLLQVAYGNRSVQDIIKTDGHAPTQDIWTLDSKKDEVDPKFNYLEKQNPVKAPSTLREAPMSLVEGTSSISAIPKPQAGTSYNPVFQEWDALLQSQGAKELEAEQKRLRQAQAEKEFEERIADVEREAQRESALMTEDESAWSGFESDFDNPEWLKKKRAERKTPQERKKVEKRKERERQDKWERKEKEKAKREKQIAELKVQVDNEAKEKERRLIHRTASTGDNEELKEEVLRRRAPRKNKVPEQPLELTLPEDLRDSLRTLKPEGNLLKDRYRNALLVRKLEARKPISQPRKKQRKLTEKWTHKDFQVPFSV
ncbi:uncharacterized protein KY384_007573 [Bacidia gigantensis]|uniref:uncharacterized protein n=1 Tax=Bacidia gigantensis TaxID=2732470 RepID=UPI001D0406BF|nr:uncharacterized protein KY384_007573 [Bacidia gigantensis]KAG8527421.1 hypothetical protein KY384_007573 [Bacidia gigantensis]